MARSQTAEAPAKPGQVEQAENNGAAEEEVISLRFKEQKVKIEDREGKIHVYTIRDTDGEGRDTYMDEIMSRSDIGEDGKPGRIKSMKGMQSLLLSMMLHDENDELVPKEIIDSWPAGAREALFEKARTIAALDDKALERAKNVSGEKS